MTARALAALLGACIALGGLALGACDSGVDEPTPECTLSTECPDRGLCIDGVCEPCDVNLPPPTDVCLPVCGNELGVGQPCTAGGGECNPWLDVPGGALFCTVDFVADADLVMCTRPCGQDADCGSGSVCTGDPADPDSDKGCVPAACNE